MDDWEMQTKSAGMIQPDRNRPDVPDAASKQPPNNMAAASLVLGIIALVTFCCCYAALPLGGLGILFGLLSCPEGKFSGYARAGMIMAAGPDHSVLDNPDSPFVLRNGGYGNPEHACAASFAGGDTGG